MNLEQLARQAGVIGAGGGGFPAGVKLAGAVAAEVDTVVANGAECEPLLHKDGSLLFDRAEQVMDGLLKVKEFTGAARAVLAVKAKHERLVSHLRSVIAAEGPAVRLALLGDFYPVGDEVALLAETLGRTVPPGGLPTAVKAVVFNVETLYNLSAASAGRPVTEKRVTLAGAVATPCTFTAPVGTRFRDLLAAAGGAAGEGTGGRPLGTDELAVIVGGPMMGRLVAGARLETLAVTRTTAGFIVVPRLHPLARQAGLSLAAQLIRAASACCGCRMCTDLCPRALLGHPLRPHQIMLHAAQLRAPDLAQAWARPLLQQAALCCECGVCEVWACPMGLSPRRVCAHLKELFRAQGAGAAPRSCAAPLASSPPARPGRRVPVARLLNRLDVAGFPPPQPAPPLCVSEVRVPLADHGGPPAEPLVRAGQEIYRGQVVGRAIGRDGQLWTQVHGSLGGVVAAVSASEVVIRGEWHG